MKSFVTMVNPKRKHFSNNQNSLENSSNVALNSDLPGEDSWVTVKKQKVTIWIPRLPSAELCVLPDLDLAQGQLQLDMPNNPASTPTQLPQASEVCIGERIDASMSVSPKSNNQSTSPDKLVATPKPEMSYPRRRNTEDQLGTLRTLCRKKRSSLKFHDISREPSRALEQSGQSEVGNLPRSITFLNNMLRASNLEKKIARAGGLSRWLSSLGLQQFERIFCGKNVDKFQLANLSMKKLKDMGADAVGPRRKLIHAIECLCLPYCSET